MKEGWLQRSFIAKLQKGIEIKINSLRFLSFRFNEIGAIKYTITPLNGEVVIEFNPYIDAGIKNEDANYDELFWDILSVNPEVHQAYIVSKTLKTEFHVATGMKVQIEKNTIPLDIAYFLEEDAKKITYKYSVNAKQNDEVSMVKFGSYVQSMNHENDKLISQSQYLFDEVSNIGFNQLLDYQKEDWAKIWETSDIVIEGDIKAQQAIRFNIFQLNQTYSGEDARLNIGPKGFTGEKYGGSTYWDTEAYCIPFYMSTKDKSVAQNLLKYRFNHLDRAIENAQKLGFKNGAALYPMVTMNGEECHNEWEITFEEIHRNGAMIYAIYNYLNYTNDFKYVADYGLEVMIGVARFWHQRANFSVEKNKYVILGVTGPNEYENNINNNFYTNYLAKWCIKYAVKNLKKVQKKFPEDYDRIIKKTKLTDSEVLEWTQVAELMYFPYSQKHNVYLQQDGFLDKEYITVDKLAKEHRPINQKWSWDRILRSCYIKQADVLQGIYMFENKFTTEEISSHFNFYEPITVHESSLSPCVHSILAAKIDKMDKAYEMYLRTSRLDLDDYNNEVHEGLHITSMAGTWLTIVQGFGGMRTFKNKLSFNPQIPKEWTSYSFKINYNGTVLKVFKSQTETKFYNETGKAVTIEINGKSYELVNELNF
jgi:maltose phosphorylase